MKQLDFVGIMNKLYRWNEYTQLKVLLQILQLLQ